ncbi:hypothetical protein HN51_006262, partial [Arachis hypogaea]
MGGIIITLVIEKTTYDLDLNLQQNGLLIPSQQVKNSSFLRPTKLESLEGKKEIEVKLMQLSLEITELTLVKWVMRKDVGAEKANTSYIL